MKLVESDEFCPCCIELRITGCLQFAHRPEFYVPEITAFRKLDLFPASGEDREASTLLGTLERDSPVIEISPF
jgi:hypothetical protein